MKGVILSINPAVEIIDITHDIAPQDIRAGAFNLLAVYRDFPLDTIHVAVVDPGVGSHRRAILIECARQFFIGPDNGIFSWICQRERDWRAREITNPKIFRGAISSTFHGRDVFAPAAAALSKGSNGEEFGAAIDKIIELESLVPTMLADGTIQGTIIHIDRFGNCITNLTGDYFHAGAKLTTNNIEINSVRRFFSEDSNSKDELFLILGSAGFIEIAARNASAASILKARSGQSVVLINDALPH